jgi:post-segregation antitoxin (ccd killing protein)
MAVQLEEHGDQVASAATETALAASGHQASTEGWREEHFPIEEPRGLEL